MSFKMISYMALCNILQHFSALYYYLAAFLITHTHNLSTDVRVKP